MKQIEQSSPQGLTDSPNIHLLARIPLFTGLPEEELHRLANLLRVREAPPKTMLFQEGDRGDNFYIILYGEVEVVKAMGTAAERLIAIRGSGDFIGELSLVNLDGLRMASVRTRGPVHLGEITHTEFAELLQRQPKITYEMLRILGNRLTEAHKTTIHDLEEKNRQLTQAYEKLKAAQAQIVEKERLERELQVAYEIQMSILPQTLPKMAGFGFGARIVPARAVGGDFFDFVPLSHNRMGIFIGDVADKGVPSAIFMARTHALLYAEARRFSTPAEVLKQVNQHLMAISEPSLFVTVLYGVLDGETGQFTYARAGHELPIFTAPNGEVQLGPWSQGQLLGVLDDPMLDEEKLTIYPNGLLLLYTDGITDGYDPDGSAFGIDRLLEETRLLAGLPAQEICARLLERLVAFQDGAPLEDDVTLLAVCATGK